MREKKVLSWLVVLACVASLATLWLAPKVTEAEEPLKFITIFHDAGTPFAVPIKEGMEDAARLLGVEAEFMGPQTFDVAQEVNMIESAIEAGIDGLAGTAPDPEAFKEVYQKAMDKGIPVVGYNTSAPDTPWMAFVGQDLVESGRVAGRLMIEYMGGKGKLAIATCCPGHTALEERIQGVKEAIEGTDIELVQIIDITPDASKGFAALEAFVTSNPDINGIVGVDAYTEVIGRYLDKSGNAGKIIGGGFDLLPSTLQSIKKGALQFTVGQNPYLQGFLPIVQLYLYHTKGVMPIDINTSVEIVDASNIDKYLEE